MLTEFPFVKISSADERILGKCDKGTRVYRRVGNEDEIADWYDKILDVAGPSISPGGVCMYAKVSRAAVYLAINEGRLTAFGFHTVNESRSVFGFKKRKRETPYVYVPVSEAKAWGKIIAEKVAAKTLTKDEEPGWVDDQTLEKITAGMEKGKYPKKGKKKK